MNGYTGCKVKTPVYYAVFISDAPFPDIPDQPAIVRQYMRHTGEIQSGLTTPHSVARALQL
jgi:hypothetical protein